MTIKQIAEKQGVSTQAVYKRIKAAGLNISDLQTENGTELTEEGTEIVNQLFTAKKERTDNLQPLINRVKELEKEVDMLTTRLKEVTAERDRWAAQAEAAQQTAQQAQALNLATLKALPAGRGEVSEEGEDQAAKQEIESLKEQLQDTKAERDKWAAQAEAAQHRGIFARIFGKK